MTYKKLCVRINNPLFLREGNDKPEFYQQWKGFMQKTSKEWKKCKVNESGRMPREGNITVKFQN